MLTPVRLQVQRRVEQLDRWEDNGADFILASDAGAHINSYTGSHGWNPNAGQEPPPINPVLRRVFEEIAGQYEQYVRRSRQTHTASIAAAAARFEAAPSMIALYEYAECVDGVCPVRLVFSEEDAMSRDYTGHIDPDDFAEDAD
jgi:hypothetical protein